MHVRDFETTTLNCTSGEHLKLLPGEQPFWGITTGDNSNQKLPVICFHPTAIKWKQQILNVKRSSVDRVCNEELYFNQIEVEPY